MTRFIDLSDSITKANSCLSCNHYFISIKERAYQATYDSFTISIAIGSRGINKVSTGIQESSTLIGSLNLIGIATPGHSS
jgi:hypothetical protein